MDGKNCVITGATSGIGKETAFDLAQKGASLVLACRNLSKGETVARSIRSKSGNERIDVAHCDLASLDSVRNFVNDFKRRYERLDVLINNAGLFSLRRQTTMDGIELTFGTNHLGPFLLTYLLLDVLKKSASARIVTVASAAHYRGSMNFNDLQSKTDYNGRHVYANSKLAHVLFTYELARKAQDTGITVNCLHPGVIATDLWPTNKWYLASIVPVAKFFMKSSKKGAQTTIHLACSPALTQVTENILKKTKAKKLHLMCRTMWSGKKSSGKSVNNCASFDDRKISERR